MAFENIDFYATLWQGRGINWLLLPDNPEKPWFAPLSRPLPAARKEQPRPTPARRTEAERPHVPQNLWPNPWLERLAATRRGRIVWTYWELGQDIYQSPDTGRRGLFQRLIADLAHPAGTHAFFPVCLPAPPQIPDQESPTVFASNAEIFWSALKQLGARAALIMGATAVKSLALEEELPLWGMSRRHGLFVWRLPEAEAVLRDEKLYSTLLEFLRSGLRDIARR